MIFHRILPYVLFLLSSGFLIFASASTCINGYRDISNTTCICDPGFEGAICEFIQPSFCFHGGTYYSSIQRCHCNQGFYGTHCEQSSSYLHCHNSGHFDPTSMTCKCTSGWGGLQCHAIYCLHGTRNPNDEDHCICDEDYDGDHCTHIKHDHCLNGGTYDHHHHRCYCRPPFTGSHCETDLQCMNGGIYNTTSNTCQCLTRWSGMHCEIISCDHGHPDNNFDDCICDNGYEGDFCAHIKHDHCLNGGTRDHHHHRCSCRPTFTGSNCETDLHCLNGGTYDISQQKCSCPSEWTGPHCENIVCDHGYPDNNLDRCICYNGYDGSHCAGIKRNHCLHGGHFSQSEMICKCYAGYYGQHCEIEPDSCYSQPCINGGTCYSSQKTFYCNCPSTFTGTQCEMHMPINPPVNQLHTVTPQPNQIPTNCTCPTTFSTVQTSKPTNGYTSTTRYPTTASTPQVLMGLTIGVLPSP